MGNSFETVLINTTINEPYTWEFLRDESKDTELYNLILSKEAKETKLIKIYELLLPFIDGNFEYFKDAIDDLMTDLTLSSSIVVIDDEAYQEIVSGLLDYLDN